MAKLLFEMKFIPGVIRQLLLLLTPADRTKSSWMLALLTISALLDFFGLAALFPVLYAVLDPGSNNSNPTIDKLRVVSGIKSPDLFLLLLLAAFLLFIVLKNIATASISRRKANFTFGIGSAMSSKLLARFLAKSWIDFTKVDFPKELDKITNLPLAFANNIVSPLGTLLSEAVLFVLLLGCAAFYDIKAFGFVVIVMVPVIIYYSFQRKVLRQRGTDIRAQYAGTMKSALQVVEGYSEIKSSATENYFTSRFKNLSQSLSAKMADEQTAQLMSARVTETVAMLMVCTLILYSTLSAQRYSQTILIVAIYAGISFRLLPSFNRILNALMQIRTHEYLFKELGEAAAPGTIIAAPVEKFPFENSIELKNISFSYANDPSLFEDINLKFGKGEKIALTGKSGTGKTTLLLILLRFLTQTKGEVLIDGKSADTINQASWLKLFAYVPQNPFMLDGSLAENIAFGIPDNEIQKEKIILILEELGLKDLLQQLPLGLDTPIGERGVRLSGGQRQRVAIARALYNDASILLLDEITNQLDKDTELGIIAVLQKLVQTKKTIVMITHHEEVLKYFDRVLNLSNPIR